jgi:hypothetical protein
MGVMNEDRFGETVGELVRDLDAVPETPHAEIWAGIAAARRFRRPPRSRRTRRIAWGLSLAATLALGFALGRIRAPGQPTPLPAAMPGGDFASLNAQAGSPQFRLAADYLARTEELLAAFPSGTQDGRSADVAEWASQLLLDTRLLIDSPTGSDPAIAPLLSDLELVLAQIASLRDGDQQEITLIVDGITQNRVLARLRVAAGAAAGSNGDD